MSSRLPPLRPPSDDRAAALVAELRAVVEESRGAVGPDAAELSHRRHEVEAKIAALDWAESAESTAIASHSITVRDVRERLAEMDAEMVSFARSGPSLRAVVVGAGRARLVDLGRATQIRERISRVRADLDALAGRTLPTVLRASVLAALENDLAGLDLAAVRPLGLGGKRVVVVAGGAVATVPWNNLPSLRDVPLCVAPSASWWAHVGQRTTSTAAGESSMIALSGPALRRSDREAEDVASVWTHGRALTGSSGTVAALAAALSSADLVHVAAHGHHEPQNPLFSSVRMADGLLFAHELTRGTLRASQVVLSACDVGLATVRPGDEPLGLTSVLLNAGPRTVVASVSRIADDIAHSATVRYHRSLASGRDPAEAVAATVAASPEPAPFVCFGAW